MPSDRTWRRIPKLRANERATVDDEIRLHLEMRAADFVALGMSPDDAMREAERRFGDRERVAAEMRVLERQKARRAVRRRVFADLWQDVTYAFRSLSRQPLFVVTAALTLGLGIGVNAAIFSAIDSFLLRPLPLRAADRLLVLNYIAPGTELPSTITWLNAVDLQQMTNVFEDVVAWDSDITNVRTQENDGERLITGNVSSNFFAALQPRMVLGRGITVEEGESRTPVIVLDYRVWERKFARDPGVLGRAVYLNGQPFTIIGVTAREFRGPESIVVYNAYIPITTTPLINPATQVRFEQRDRGSVRVFAHLKPGVSLSTAREALKEFGARQAELYPKENSGTIYIATLETRARPDPAVSGGVVVTASVFLALCALVLLVACANVANLIFARTAWRQGELAVRRALGASGGRVIRLLLTETIVIAALAFGVGLLLARFAIAWLDSRSVAVDVPISFRLSLDWRVVTYAGVAALIAGVVAGLGSAWHASRGAVSTTLREGGRGGSNGPARARVRNVLVTAQVAMSLLLLVCAALFTRSARASMQADFGFRKDSLAMSVVDVTPLHYDAAKTQRFFETWAERSAALPGVKSVGLIQDAPLSGNNNGLEVHFNEEIPGVKDRRVEVFSNVMTPGLFATLGIRLVAGRDFTLQDDSTTPPVLIVNKAFASRYFAGREAVGQRVRLRASGPEHTIVGVVSDYKFLFSWEDARPAVFAPFRQRLPRIMTLVAHTGQSEATLAALRGVVKELDPELVPYSVRTIETHLRDGIALFFQRMGAVIAATIGLLGLAQTVVGLYGVLAYAVSQRTKEIGIRMALGARQIDVVGDVVRQGARLVLIGGAIGLALTLATSRLLRSILYGVSGFDLASYGGAALVLGVLALVSCYLPARRAARLEPTRALRAE